MKPCVFCEIVHGRSPSTIVDSDGDALGIVPLNPVVEGHVIFLSRVHVANAAEDPAVTARVMRSAAAYARRNDEDFNIITSAGAAATQTVFHLHIHVVPRQAGDGLHLPWGTNE